MATPKGEMFGRILSVLGRTFIAVGVLLLLFVTYEVWGTNLQEASSQRKLNKEFGVLLDRRPAGSTTTTTAAPRTTVSSPTTPRTAPAAPARADIPLPNVGDAIAKIRIPEIGVSKTVVQGVTLDQLKRAPGHYPETVLPGQKGNAGIAGHRTTYGAPFHNIDKLKNGDEIIVVTLQGEFRYKVDSTVIVAPSDVSVLADKGDNRLTLTACHPKYSASQRIIVSGVLVGNPVPRLKGQAGIEKQRTVLPGRTDQANRVQVEGGLDGTKTSKVPAILWGSLCALVWFTAWAASRVVRRRSNKLLWFWTPYVVGLPVFLVVLYVFFENFGRLLPSNF